MKLRKAIAVVMAAAISFAFVGCDINDLSSDNLLRPPKTMGDEAEIEQLIAQTANEDYTLKYPKSGNYRSAIIMQDLDGDGKEEAIAFYRKGKDVTKLHMLVMYSADDRWKLSDDFVTETTDVDCVDFANISGDDATEILVGFNTYTPNSNFLTCYSYSGGKTTEIKSGQNYSNFYCGDFNADGSQEIMTLSLFSAEIEANATMIVYDREKNMLTSKATVAMDPNVIRIKNAAVTKLDENLQGVVVDGTFSDNQTNTQIIYYNKELSILRNPLYKENSKSFTQRKCNIISADIDDDSIFEIPSVQALPKPENLSEKNVADIVTWSKFHSDDEAVLPQVKIVPYYDYLFSFSVPSTWKDGTFTAVIDSANSLITFYDCNKESLGDRLFEIKVFDAAQWDKGQNNDDYTLIYKDNRYAYTFNNYNSSGEHSLTDDEIKTAFSVLTEVAD